MTGFVGTNARRRFQPDEIGPATGGRRTILRRKASPRGENDEDGKKNALRIAFIAVSRGHASFFCVSRTGRIRPAVSSAS